ncbi:MAG TPA: HAMP domain-containing sensor histidine kinase [Rhizomicrobium sp.]|nr:HAMP domain-containing sensor histidine kinase [Rhizomicrobium sp.]
MRAPKTLRTLAFRIVLVYVAIFAASAVALVAFTYWNTKRALDAETDQTIEAEIAGLSEQYQRLGIAGLTDVIIGRSMRGSLGLYLLTDAQKRPIAGNLDTWPQAKPREENFIEFDFERRAGGGIERHRARGKTFALTGGFQLLVARDVDERYKTQRLFTTTLPWTVILMLALGLGGGALMSRNLLARLDSINRISREIMAGDLTRRLPLTRDGDEFDTLAENLNRMLERTERLMKGMRTVTDSIAHDLRTPLNRLRNRLEGVLNHLGGENVEAREIEAAVGETDTLIGTFNALLLIAEAEAGVGREAMAPVDLPVVVEGISELYGPVAEEKGVSLEVAPSGTARIEGNGSLISQALANLVDNAIKYTPAGGLVRIAVQNTSAGIALSVADNGPGIPSGDHARVLERFVRLEASRNSPGTGLGLSLVAAVARLHDAKLELSDNMPGLKATLLFAGRMSRRPALAS